MASAEDAKDTTEQKDPEDSQKKKNKGVLDSVKDAAKAGVQAFGGDAVNVAREGAENVAGKVMDTVPPKTGSDRSQPTETFKEKLSNKIGEAGDAVKEKADQFKDRVENPEKNVGQNVKDRVTGEADKEAVNRDDWTGSQDDMAKLSDRGQVEMQAHAETAERPPAQQDMHTRVASVMGLTPAELDGWTSAIGYNALVGGVNFAGALADAASKGLDALFGLTHALFGGDPMGMGRSVVSSVAQAGKALQPVSRAIGTSLGINEQSPGKISPEAAGTLRGAQYYIQQNEIQQYYKNNNAWIKEAAAQAAGMRPEDIDPEKIADVLEGMDSSQRRRFQEAFSERVQREVSRIEASGRKMDKLDETILNSYKQLGTTLQNAAIAGKRRSGAESAIASNEASLLRARGRQADYDLKQRLDDMSLSLQGDPVAWAKFETIKPMLQNGAWSLLEDPDDPTSVRDDLLTPSQLSAIRNRLLPFRGKDKTGGVDQYLDYISRQRYDVNEGEAAARRRMGDERFNDYMKNFADSSPEEYIYEAARYNNRPIKISSWDNVAERASDRGEIIKRARDVYNQYLNSSPDPKKDPVTAAKMAEASNIIIVNRARNDFEKMVERYSKESPGFLDSPSYEELIEAYQGLVKAHPRSRGNIDMTPAGIEARKDALRAYTVTLDNLAQELRDMGKTKKEAGDSGAINAVDRYLNGASSDPAFKESASSPFIKAEKFANNYDDSLLGLFGEFKGKKTEQAPAEQAQPPPVQPQTVQNTQNNGGNTGNRRSSREKKVETPQKQAETPENTKKLPENSAKEAVPVESPAPKARSAPKRKKKEYAPFEELLSALLSDPNRSHIPPFSPENVDAWNRTHRDNATSGVVPVPLDFSRGGGAGNVPIKPARVNYKAAQYKTLARRNAILMGALKRKYITDDEYDELEELNRAYKRMTGRAMPSPHSGKYGTKVGPFYEEDVAARKAADTLMRSMFGNEFDIKDRRQMFKLASRLSDAGMGPLNRTHSDNPFYERIGYMRSMADSLNPKNKNDKIQLDLINRAMRGYLADVVGYRIKSSDLPDKFKGEAYDLAESRLNDLLESIRDGRYNVDFKNRGYLKGTKADVLNKVLQLGYRDKGLAAMKDLKAHVYEIKDSPENDVRKAQRMKKLMEKVREGSMYKDLSYFYEPFTDDDFIADQDSYNDLRREILSIRGAINQRVGKLTPEQRAAYGLDTTGKDFDSKVTIVEGQRKPKAKEEAVEEAVKAPEPAPPLAYGDFDKLGVWRLPKDRHNEEYRRAFNLFVDYTAGTLANRFRKELNDPDAIPNEDLRAMYNYLANLTPSETNPTSFEMRRMAYRPQMVALMREVEQLAAQRGLDFSKSG